MTDSEEENHAHSASNAIDRHDMNGIVHGLAHGGSPEGKTGGAEPVAGARRFVRERVGLTSCCPMEVTR